MTRRATFLLYAGAFGLAGLYVWATSPGVRQEVYAVAARLQAKAKSCTGCQRRREAMGRMFAQAHEAVNWGRTLHD